MLSKETYEKLIAYIKKNYIHDACDYTSERSYGNYDDVFWDGYSCGESNTLYEIAELLGVENQLHGE